MSSRLWLFLLLATASLFAQAPGPFLQPFGNGFKPIFTFSERYTEDVRYSPEDKDYVDALITYLAFSAEVSMQGINPRTFDEDTTFSIDIGNLSLELDLDEGVKTVTGTTTKVVWTLEGFDPITFEFIENAGTVTLTYNATKLTVDAVVRNVPDDYNIMAPDEAGSETEYDDFPLILDFIVGEYGFTGRTCYVDGRAELYDKTVGTGDNKQDFIGLAKVLLSGEIDMRRPVVAITYPPSRQTINERPITIRGTARDDHSVPAVQVQVNTGSLMPANYIGDDQWALDGVVLQPGQNSILVRATDPDGNTDETTRTVRYSPVSNLTVTAAGDGSGKVTSTLFETIKYQPGQPAPVRIAEREDATPLKLTAVPGADAVFDRWTSNRTITPKQAASPKLSILMQPNMTLTAHFLKNPFLPVQGKYTGLLGGADPADRGYLSGKLSPLGAFSLKAKIGKLTLKLKGAFSNTGQYSGTVVKNGVTYQVTLALNIGATGEREITGTIVGGDVNATVDANLSGFSKKNPAPAELVGTFNVLLPAAGGNADANYPAGIGFGRVTVKSTGSVKFIGTLGDLTPLTAGGALSAGKIWPFFGALYAKKGSIGGPISFDLADPAHDLSGSLDWFKPAGAKPATLHPEGFTGRSTLVGAKFAKPAAGQLLFLQGSAGAGQLLLNAPANGTDAALAGIIPGTLGANGKITFGPPSSGTATNPKFILDLQTGLFTGSFDENGVKRTMAGAVVGPKLNRAGGVFVRGTRSGAAEVTP
jgi:hypothetical protein